MAGPDKRILQYIESLESQVAGLKACLNDGRRPEQLKVACRSVSLSAAVLEEAVERSTGNEAPLHCPEKRTTAERTPPEDLSNESETA